MNVLAIGFTFPCDQVESVPSRWPRSFLDADLVIVSPSSSGDPYGWAQEAIKALKAGRNVFVFLDGDSEDFLNGVLPAKPYRKIVRRTSGERIKLNGLREVFGSYFSLVSDRAIYVETVEYLKDFEAVFGTHHGSVPVGGVYSVLNGKLVVLPSVGMEQFSIEHDVVELDTVLEGDDDLRQFGHQLLVALINIDKKLRSGDSDDPIPNWVDSHPYAETSNRTRILDSIKLVTDEIAVLEESRQNLRQELGVEDLWLTLLYDTGSRLESTVRDAMRILGFQVEHYVEGSTEIDLIFTSDEGRFIGEVEGKDTKPIDISKHRQLEDNIQDDFTRHDDHAIGVLFANAMRLLEPSLRQEWFTEKCLKSAKRAGTALVRTPDLLPLINYLRETADHEFAKECRMRIAESKGKIVEFPPLP